MQEPTFRPGRPTPEERRANTERRQADDRRRLANHYQDQLRLSQLEAALAECVRYIATTYDNCHVITFHGAVAPKREPECSIAAKHLLGWTLG